MRNLRLLDCQNNFVKMLDEEEARQMIKAGQATMRETGRRAVLVLTIAKTVDDCSAGSVASGHSTVYLEDHAGQKIHVLMRPAGDGTFSRWDNELTFSELRAGRRVSAQRQAERLLAERARRNCEVMPEDRAA